MNSVNIIGRVTKEPEMKTTEDGRTICTLRIAMDDIRSKDDRTDFITVTVYGSQANQCKRYLRKGFLCGISGRLHSELVPNEEGIRRYAVTVVADRVQYLQWPERNENRPSKVDVEEEE